MIATLVTVLSESAAVSLALRLAVVEMVSAVPTHTTMTRIPSAPTTSPGLIRRRVRRASQRWENAPKTTVVAMTRITGAGICVEAVVSESTRSEVAW